jgi:hypothetical protein
MESSSRPQFKVPAAFDCVPALAYGQDQIYEAQDLTHSNVENWEPDLDEIEVCIVVNTVMNDY